MSAHDTPPDEKAEVRQQEVGGAGNHRYHVRHSKFSEEVQRIDAIATSQTTTLQSFRHLDEKKILRKVKFLFLTSS